MFVKNLTFLLNLGQLQQKRITFMELQVKVISSTYWQFWKEDGRFLVEWQYHKNSEVYQEQTNTFLSEYGTKVLKVTYISHEYRNKMNFQTFQQNDDVIATFGKS